MQKNDIIKTETGTFRILVVEEEKVLAIDCEKKTMPRFFPLSDFENGEILEQIPSSFPSWEELSPNERKIAQKRYTMIAAAVAFIADKQKRNAMIDYASAQFDVSKQTLRSFLCSYLVYQDIAVLAPQRTKEKELTKDQKNIRWALNKFFYTRNQNSLSTAYTMMLKEKYCDLSGNLLSEYPSFNQFRYFYRKTRKMENFHISRDGLTAYQRNNRPLVGDGVQEFAPCIGTAMLDSTVCDIYLMDERGELAGRPILTAACDANTSMCLGYVLLWQNDTNSLKDLMLNILGDKVSFCKKKGIHITNVQWDVQNQLPGILVTDQGHEHTSQNFERIIYYNCSRVIENYPYDPETLDDEVPPSANEIWNWKKENAEANLIDVFKKDLILTLLPRTMGKFTRRGLKVNGLRYFSEGYKEQFLGGGNVIISYDPENCNKVWLKEKDGSFVEFTLIEKRFSNMSLEEIQNIQCQQKQLVQNATQNQYQAKIDLMNFIETVTKNPTNNKKGGQK